MKHPSRREFVQSVAGAAAGLGLAGLTPPLRAAQGEPLYRISLAQWSLNKAIFGGQLDPLDFPRITREEYGLEGAEYVNQFFMDKARDSGWLGELKRRAADAGVKSLLIMCDREGRLGDPDPAKRAEAVENHEKWLEAAAFLGCHSIRVNAASEGTREAQVELAADGLRRLSERGEAHGLNVIVENHGGLSSDGAWLSAVMKAVDHPRCGTLPDFGNFRIEGDEWYDRYQGVTELMPWAKAVSAKSHEFDADGDETRTDYRRMMKIVIDAGYSGWVGIEYEGDGLSAADGIRATKALLEKVRAELSAA
jgi:sugar phosphate isomerase/epimerase